MWKALVASLCLVLACGGILPAARAQDESNRSQGEASFSARIDAAKGAMMRDPQAALDLTFEAESLIAGEFAESERGEPLAMVLWLRSEAMTRLGQPVEAQPVVEQAMGALGTEPPQTKLYADILVSRGRIAKIMGDYALAMQSFQSAYDVFVAIEEPRSESIVLQSIASIYTDAHQYERAVSYYVAATERYQDDPSLELAALNNLGNAYREMRRFGDAERDLTRAHDLAVEMDSPLLQARVLNNLASLQAEMGNVVAATQSLDTAFSFIDPDTTEWARFLWGARAQVALAQGDVAAARRSIGRTFDGVSLRDSNQSFTEFHEVAADIYQANGDWSLAVQHMRAFKRLDDEAREVAASANTALLGAQFDFAEQELQIEHLRTDGLEHQLALSDARARQRLIMTVGIALISVLAMTGGGFYYRALRQRQKALERLVFEDAETGLPSRQALKRRLRKMPADMAAGASILALGLDRFDPLLEALGYARMAELKRAIAVRLAEVIEADMIGMLTPSVVGMVLRGTSPAAARNIAVSLRAALATPLQLEELAVDVTMTGGIAPGSAGDTCARQAVMAIDQARAIGAISAIFNQASVRDHSASLSLMSQMQTAMRSGHIQMHYQPKLHLKTGTYAAAEALVRWTDPERGAIPPSAFVEMAEETGRIREFTEWTIERVVNDQKHMARSGFNPLLAVNISGALISDTEFADRALEAALGGNGKVSFEITETSAMRDPERALANLKKWRDAGIKLAIDDYGTGVSSLAYLRSLPCQELKLDRAFVTNIASSRRDRMVVKSTTDLAHALGLELTAEGVECEASLALLKIFGCDWAQGYVLSRALPLEALQHFLTINQTPAEIDTSSVRGIIGL
tara:strand:- start:5429 stop:8017 length:2589 start_codon:yes stop_codon:yes gene_type:complete